MRLCNVGASESVPQYDPAHPTKHLPAQKPLHVESEVFALTPVKEKVFYERDVDNCDAKLVSFFLSG